jgi:hypothetical protein
MSKFDELRAAWKDWRERNINYHRTAIQFAHRFARGFQEYIGAPAKYKDIGEKPEWSYVEVRKLTDENEIVRVEDLRELVTFEDDGFCRFGLGPVVN